MQKTVNNRRHFRLWLGLSILVCLYYGLISAHYCLNQDYVVQDDARQHVVWLQRFIDPQLFPDDLIADYFMSLAPLGYKAVYWITAKIGIEPIFLAKILPIFLGLVTTIYTYFFSLQILALPSTAFLSSLFLNQLIWLNDDLISSTPRAFLYPLFAAWLYYLSKNKLILCLILMTFQGLFYPQILLLELAILSVRLLRWNKLQLTQDKQDYLWWILGLIVTIIVLLPLTQKPTELATTVTASQMQQMPEFNLSGRSTFFGVNPVNFWLNDTSGLGVPLFPPIIWLGFCFPLLVPQRLKIIKIATSQLVILRQVAIASLLMFFVAHLVLPKIHLPGRYTYHSIRFLLAISTAIIVTNLSRFFEKWLQKNSKQAHFKIKDKFKLILISLFSLTVIIFPAVPSVFINWFQSWQIGQDITIYQFLAQQPKDTLIASLTPEVSNIPAFSQRSILVSREFAIAYHPYYYQQIKQRTVDLIQAQYSDDIQNLVSFINKYQVNFFLLDKTAFSPEYLKKQKWLNHSSWQPKTYQVISYLESGQKPIMSELITPCLASSTEDLILLDAHCIFRVGARK
ncbi:hypothetical protein [Pleurocapsa sp. PCC 7319]|uniref:hypothetical protein n=1 Tax=Pleurocapsa sp. PCC 7319 TaxID=118161 RepID=UPI000378DF05|nr:hypothetical protein [Pleurocapsa sp. PCC 7319]